jgi:hypothetical protein
MCGGWKVQQGVVEAWAQQQRKRWPGERLFVGNDSKKPKGTRGFILMFLR